MAELVLYFLLSFLQQPANIQRAVRLPEPGGLPQRNVQFQAHQDHIHLDHLFRGIVPVTGVGVGVRGDQRPDPLIIPQRFLVDMAKPGELPDGQIPFHDGFSLLLLTLPLWEGVSLIV